jgi:hypothetical protein
MEFHTTYLRIIPLDNCEFLEIRHSESHTLLKGVIEILPIFNSFRLTWIKLGTEDVHKNLLSGFSFEKWGQARP